MRITSIRDVVGLTVRDSKRFFWASLALVFGGAINLVFPHVMRLALTEESPLYIVTNAATLGVVLAGLFLVQGICFYFRTLLFGELGHGVAHNLRVELYRSLVAKPISFFDRNHSGDVVSCLVADAQMLQNAISVRVSVMLRYGLQVLGGVALMLWLSPLLTLLILLILPVLVGTSLLLAKRLKTFTQLQQQKLGEASQFAEEMLGAMDVVKAFAAEHSQFIRFQSVSETVYTLGCSRARVSAFFQSFVSFLLNVALLVLFLYAVSLVDREYISLAELTAFLLYGGIVAVSFALLVGSFSDLVQASAALQRIEDMKEREDTGEDTEQQQDLQEASLLESIAFQDVTFAYPARPEAVVLEELSFSIPPGRVSALVGQSGAGKTAVIELILGLYRPVRGRILVGEIDLRGVDMTHYRMQIGYVPQDSALFGMSILENLQLGGAVYPMEEIEAVFKAVNLSDFIHSLPEGYNTYLGARGAQLSGGQKQRLAIARALLRKPKLLILDEATSALDQKNEQDIIRAVKALEITTTILLITHRASTLTVAENILRLEAGRIKSAA